MMDDLVTPLRVVSVLDPAIERGRSDVIRYAETRDMDALAFKVGMAPLAVYLRPLDVIEHASVDALPAGAAKLLRACMHAIQRIEGLGRDPATGAFARGLGVEWSPATSVAGPSGQRLVMDESEIRDLGVAVGASWLYEIGQVAYERASMGKMLGGGGGYYTLPQSSALGLSQIARRLAEQFEAAASTPSKPPSAPPSPSPSPPSSAAPTDAPAEGGTASPAG